MDKDGLVLKDGLSWDKDGLVLKDGLSWDKDGLVLKDGLGWARTDCFEKMDYVGQGRIG